MRNYVPEQYQNQTFHQEWMQNFQTIITTQEMIDGKLLHPLLSWVPHTPLLNSLAA